METKDKKNKTTMKRHGSKRRPNRFEVTLSNEELAATNVLMKKAGGRKSVPSFIRELLVGGGVVKARLTPEERKEIAQLTKIGSNLWQLRKDLNNFGVDKKLLEDLESLQDDLGIMLSYYHKKMV